MQIKKIAETSFCFIFKCLSRYITQMRYEYKMLDNKERLMTINKLKDYNENSEYVRNILKSFIFKIYFKMLFRKNWILKLVFPKSFGLFQNR